MKLMIDIPDNELKVPLKNIHLLISDGIIGEVCIKKYDKDEPYFMNLNFTFFEECGDCISRQAAINVVVCDILSSAIVYGRTEEGMSAKKAIVDGLKRLQPVTPAEKVGHWIKLDDCSNSGYYCSECHKRVVKEGWSDTVKIIKYCPNCGAKIQEVEE